jgi:hypothetical protein
MALHDDLESLQSLEASGFGTDTFYPLTGSTGTYGLRRFAPTR